MTARAMDMRVDQRGADFGKFCNVLKSNVQVAANQTSERFMLRLRDDVVSAIWEQRFKLKPLTPKYKKWKAMNGFDTRILISTAQYVDSITTWKQARGKMTVLHVGVYPNRYYKSRDGRKVRIVDVARWLEYGTVKMPARPVWFLSFKRLRKNLKTFRAWFARQVNKGMKKDARKYKGKKKKVV